MADKLLQLPQVRALLRFKPQDHFILASLFGKRHHIFAAHAFHALQQNIDLARVDIDALHLDHIVRTPENPVVAGITPPAGAFSRNQAGHIVRAVAQQRRALLAERRDNDFPVCPVRHIFTRFRVYDLEIQEIVEIMEPRMIFTVNGNPRAINFGQAVDVKKLDAEALADALAHLVAPPFRADDALFKRQPVPESQLLHLLCKQQGIRRGGADYRCFKVRHHLQLFFRVARPHRHRHRPQRLAARLEPDARRPQAKARRNLYPVGRRHAGNLVAAFEHPAPVGDVLRRIRDNHRVARCSRGGMDAHNPLLRHGHQPQRICPAKVCFIRKGNLFNVLRRFDILRQKPAFRKFLFIKRAVFIHVFQLLQKQLVLCLRRSVSPFAPPTQSYPA
ncbi:MAG: hypothetical protein DELT_03040 [Desulfovibrio sp.]